MKAANFLFLSGEANPLKSDAGDRRFVAVKLKPRTFVFNFQPRFAELVASGKKLQTIRANRKDGKRPEPGDQVRLYTHLRTRNTRWLFDGVVTRCRGVRIDLTTPRGEVVVDGQLLGLGQRLEFAQADGFDSWLAMHTWFKDAHMPHGGGSFEGFCVEWISSTEAQHG